MDAEDNDLHFQAGVGSQRSATRIITHPEIYSALQNQSAMGNRGAGLCSSGMSGMNRRKCLQAGVTGGQQDCIGGSGRRWKTGRFFLHFGIRIVIMVKSTQRETRRLLPNCLEKATASSSPLAIPTGWNSRLIRLVYVRPFAIPCSE